MWILPVTFFFPAAYQQRSNTSLRNSITPLEKHRIPIRFASFSHTHSNNYCEISFCLIMIVMLFTARLQSPFFVCARPPRVPCLGAGYGFLTSSGAAAASVCLLSSNTKSDHFTQPHNDYFRFPLPNAQVAANNFCFLYLRCLRNVRTDAIISQINGILLGFYDGTARSQKQQQ